MVYVSKRIQEIPASGTIAISNLVSDLKAQGIDIVSFSMGEPDFVTPSNIIEAAKESLDSGFTHYTPSTGIPELKEAIASGEVDILIGTQMIAKGLDFPNVTMVGIVAADAMLKLPDYRSAERTFQLLTQVAGRAGRADVPGEVFLQTYDPENYAVEAASRQDYRAFFEERAPVHLHHQQAQQHQRRADARLLFEADDEKTAQQAAETAMRLMEAFFERRAYLKKYVIALRAMACPIKKIKGKSRWQTTLKIVDQPICQEAVGKMSEIAAAPTAGCLCVCQVNPSSMM